MSGLNSMLELVVRVNELVGKNKFLREVIKARDETIEELKDEIVALEKQVYP